MNRLLTLGQPPVARERVAAASTALLRYRVMAFVTGVVLLAGTIMLIVKYTTDAHVEPYTGWLWVAHGYLYLVYVIMSVLLGARLKWPLPRFVLVMLAGTIPTMSFVAEHFVTRAARTCAVDQPDGSAAAPAVRTD